MTSSRAQLVHVAKRLGPLRERAVFCGGGATLEISHQVLQHSQTAQASGTSLIAKVTLITPLL